MDILTLTLCVQGRRHIISFQVTTSRHSPEKERQPQYLQDTAIKAPWNDVTLSLDTECQRQYIQNGCHLVVKIKICILIKDMSPKIWLKEWDSRKDFSYFPFGKALSYYSTVYQLVSICWKIFLKFKRHNCTSFEEHSSIISCQ